jgi:hypothetical protein
MCKSAENQQRAHPRFANGTGPNSWGLSGSGQHRSAEWLQLRLVGSPERGVDSRRVKLFQPETLLTNGVK